MAAGISIRMPKLIDNVDKKEPHSATRDRGARETVDHEAPARVEYVPPAIDRVEQASIDSFPCSDAPGYYACHL